MSPLLFFSLLIGIGVTYCGYPNNLNEFSRNKSKCRENEISCQTKVDLWSCCPFENGVCCSDGLYCCPKNEKCSSNGTCLSLINEISFAFPLTFEDEENHLKTIPCPDGNVCADDETCCELSSGHYACCPHPDGVCCNDHIHCCPKDHICDFQNGHCKKQFDQLTNIVCPDGASECPNGFTCCELESGSYGCCPTHDAVCCSDHVHCCPHGTTCSVERERCVSEISIPWMRKRIPLQIKQKIVKQDEKSLSRLNDSFQSDKDIICQGASKSICTRGDTCCPSTNQSSVCCPGENAVCCADNIHCCPTNSQCDLDLFQCVDQFNQSKTILKKRKVQKKISSKIESDIKSSSSLSTLICPDENVCPDETTCCELSNNTFGCCPYENANCCSDRIHCCGNGYVCADGGDRCIRRFNSFSSSLKRSLIQYHFKEDQLCPDGKSQCPKNSTCCPNQNSNELTYSCCPYSKGVCCGSNGSVCCPNNYNCNEEELSCELRDSIFGRKLLQRIDYYQCDSSNIFCPLDEICCSTYGTSDDPFGCCPYSNGECCSDGKHCCPQGQLCDNQSGECLLN